MDTMRKKNRLMFSLFFILFLFFLFQTPFLVNTSSNDGYVAINIVVFAKDICLLCPQDKEEWDFQQQYVFDLENELSSKQFEVTYLVGFADYQQLTASYEDLSAPGSIRTMDMIVIIDEKFIFISYVPIEIIEEFLEDYSPSYSKFILAKDSLQPMEYKIVEGESEEIKSIRIEESLEEAIERPPNTKETSFLSTPIGIISVIAVIGIVMVMIIFILRRNRQF